VADTIPDQIAIDVLLSIRPITELYLDLDASSIMTIGAGGKVKQVIIEDRNDPRIWDTQNAKLLSIQILNASAFQHVTGSLPPPSPVTLETYSAQSLPFYNAWNERPPKGIRGLHGIQSISESSDISANDSALELRKCGRKATVMYVRSFVVITLLKLRDIASAPVVTCSAKTINQHFFQDRAKYAKKAHRKFLVSIRQVRE